MATTQDIISEWYFDGNANDSSGNGYNGSVSGASFTTASKLGSGAIQLDGYNDYVNYGNMTIFNGLTTFSFSGWIKPDIDLTNETKIIFGKMGSYPNDFYLDWSNGKLRFTPNEGSGRAEVTWTPTKNTWYHIVVLYDGNQPSGNRVRIFINNTEQTVSNTVGTSIVSNSGNLYVGNHGRALSSHYSWSGVLDEFYMWSRVLSDDEVADLYNSGLGARPSPAPTGWSHKINSIIPNMVNEISNTNISMINEV